MNTPAPSILKFKIIFKGKINEKINFFLNFLSFLVYKIES